MKAAMQKRVEEAVAETEAKASGLRDAREKNVHFSARVVALNARVAAQQKDLRNLTAINASLTQELEQLRSLRSRPAEAAPLENGTSPFILGERFSAWIASLSAGGPIGGLQECGGSHHTRGPCDRCSRSRQQRLLPDHSTLTWAPPCAGARMDGDTPPKQRMVGWRGDLQTATSGTPATDWAGLAQEQEALLGALQVPAAAPDALPVMHPTCTRLALELCLSAMGSFRASLPAVGQ